MSRNRSHYGSPHHFTAACTRRRLRSSLPSGAASFASASTTTTRPRPAWLPTPRVRLELPHQAATKSPAHAALCQVAASCWPAPPRVKPPVPEPHLWRVSVAPSHRLQARSDPPLNCRRLLYHKLRRGRAESPRHEWFRFCHKRPRPRSASSEASLRFARSSLPPTRLHCGRHARAGRPASHPALALSRRGLVRESLGFAGLTAASSSCPGLTPGRNCRTDPRRFTVAACSAFKTTSA